MTTEYSIARSLAPFVLVSSSVSGGFINAVRRNLGLLGLDLIRNDLREKYIDFTGLSSPIQGPFTDTHVGGFQYRHITVGTGSDSILYRPEGYHLTMSNSNQNIRIYSHRFGGSPPAFWSRGNLAKSPLNISHIRTTGSTRVLGNYQEPWEIVQTSGRYNNNFLKEQITGSEDIGQLISSFVSGSDVLNLRNKNRLTTTEISDKANKHIIVTLFSAPGDKTESSRAYLDPESEELSPNNSINYRNYKAKKLLNNKSKQSQT